MTIIVSISSIANGWMLVRHNSLQTKLKGHDEKIAKLELDLAVEKAKREGMHDDLARIDEGLQQLNSKLDRMLLGEHRK